MVDFGAFCYYYKSHLNDIQYESYGSHFVIYETDKIEEVAKHNGRELLNTTARKTVKTIKYGANKFVMFLIS